jgi:hypothetical protein
MTIETRVGAMIAMVTVLVLSACGRSIAYEAREGDILFQSLPHAPLVDAIEGITRSPYSHCGMVARRGGQWIVIEAVGPVTETPLKDWVRRGRDHRFAAYRLPTSMQPSIPRILEVARQYLGRPYDIHYDFDDERIYCSELIYKAVRSATGKELGTIARLGELNWQPHEAFIRSIENSVPLDRRMITPRALSEAPELMLIHSFGD